MVERVRQWRFSYSGTRFVFHGLCISHPYNSYEGFQITSCWFFFHSKLQWGITVSVYRPGPTPCRRPWRSVSSVAVCGGCIWVSDCRSDWPRPAEHPIWQNQRLDYTAPPFPPILSRPGLYSHDNLPISRAAASVWFRFGPPFSSKRLWFVDTVLGLEMALITAHLNAGVSHSGQLRKMYHSIGVVP